MQEAGSETFKQWLGDQVGPERKFKSDRTLAIAATLSPNVVGNMKKNW